MCAIWRCSAGGTPFIINIRRQKYLLFSVNMKQEVTQLKKSLDRRWISVILLIVMSVIFYLNKPLFLSPKNIISMLREASFTGIIACGAAFVIITGGIDNSVGSGMALTAMICANMLRFTSIPMPAALILVIILGIVLGAFNGVLVAKLSIPDFVVTLSTMNIYRGLTKVFNDTSLEALQNPMIQNQTFEKFGSKIGSVYWVTILFFLVAVITQYILRCTRLGLYTYAVGSNAQAARLTGISFSRTKIFAYSLTGLMCALAGIMTAARMMTATTEIGIGMEFSVISAIVIGGCSLQGGRGDILGVVVGTLLMTVINSGIVQMGISTYFQPVIKGIVILAAVLLDIGYSVLDEKRSRARAEADSTGE